MRIQYISDVHLEHRGGELPLTSIGVEAPTLVLAGDLGHVQSQKYRALLEWANEHFHHTFVVLGNHEYYGARSMGETERDMQLALQGLPRVHWLHRTTYDHPEGIRFAGAPLWSEVTPACFRALVDRKRIRWDDDTPFSHDLYMHLHRDDRAFFEHAIVTSPLPVVCVSHHAPLLEMNGVLNFADNPLRSGFCTDLSPLFHPPVRAWIHGHTHQSLRVDQNGIPCVSNCLGYPSERGLYPGFRVGAVIDV